MNATNKYRVENREHDADGLDAELLDHNRVETHRKRIEPFPNATTPEQYKIIFVDAGNVALHPHSVAVTGGRHWRQAKRHHIY